MFLSSAFSTGTISSYIAQFKAMFIKIGRVEPWEQDIWKDSVKLEQAMSHVSSKQAKPIF